jgi:carbamoyltransferase
MAMPVWIKEKVLLKSAIQKELISLSYNTDKSALPPLLFTEHHESHASPAFYPSPFERAAVLCMDGVGEWVTTSAWLGEGNSISPLWEISFPTHSVCCTQPLRNYAGGYSKTRLPRGPNRGR